jgi:hypothetical protein
MIKPVYFPHTYLPPSTVDSLRNIFPCVAVYQPTAGRLPDEMRVLAENGFAEVVAPAAGDEDDFDRLIRDFLDWGRTHQGGAGLKAALLYGRPLGGAASADGSPSEIASQLKRRWSTETAAREVDAALAARVFLQLAQAADQQRHQIAGDLARVDEAQAQLFDALKGGSDPAASEFGLPQAFLRDHAGEDRLEMRLASWVRLFLSLPYPSPVFVTHSPALIRRLAETVQGRLQLTFEDLSRPAGKTFFGQPPSADDILSQLAALGAGLLCLPDPAVNDAERASAAGRAEESGVHVWPEMSPFSFFSRLLPASVPGYGRPPPQVVWRHTIVVQIDSKTPRE